MSRPFAGDAGALLATLLKRLLAFDASDQSQRLQRLEGRTIAIVLRDHERKIYATIDNAAVKLHWQFDGQPDVSMNGRLVDFIALARANKRGESIAAGRIEITGDIAIAQDVQAMLNALELDLEELLSRYVGDVAAHQVGNLARTAGRGGLELVSRFERNVADFLANELRALPLRDEVDEQRRAIFTLSDDVERIAARLQRLRTPKRGA